MHAFLKGGSLPQKEKSAAKEKHGSCEAKRSRAVPWVEKYRPRCVDEVAHQEEVVAVLKKSLQGADLPNLLFYGPPGTGKTSAILAAARDLFGPELYTQRVLELNASDERGIQVVRHKVKNFAQLTASSTRKDGSPCPPFKIVVLDEADSMTSAAQAALRRTMERETKTTRFCLICNYVSRIIEPLTSRCSKFRFKPLSDAAQEQRVKHVCDQEGLKIEQEALSELVKVAEGDLRRAITMLQSAARLVVGATITRAIIMEISASVPTAMLNALVEACRSSSIDKMDLAVQNICCEGYAATTLIGQLHEVVLCRADLSDRQKSAIADKLGEVDKCLVDGADEYLQMLALCSVLMTQFNRPAE